MDVSVIGYTAQRCKHKQKHLMLSRAQMQICTEEFAKYVIVTVLTKGALVYLFFVLFLFYFFLFFFYFSSLNWA